MYENAQGQKPMRVTQTFSWRSNDRRLQKRSYLNNYIWVVPWEIHHKKHKDLRKCFDVSRFVELFSLIILVKKTFTLSSTNGGARVKILKNVK